LYSPENDIDIDAPAPESNGPPRRWFCPHFVVNALVVFKPAIVIPLPKISLSPNVYDERIFLIK